jgi:hypothetical protein
VISPRGVGRSPGSDANSCYRKCCTPGCRGLWRDRWASTGPFGRTVLSIDDALRFIAPEDIFWVITRRQRG